MSDTGDLGLLLSGIASLTCMVALAVAWSAKAKREQRGEPRHPLTRSRLAISIMGPAFVLLVSSAVLIYA